MVLKSNAPTAVDVAGYQKLSVSIKEFIDQGDLLRRTKAKSLTSEDVSYIASSG
jgi:hypothetical protein